jgi:hypothetical protein
MVIGVPQAEQNVRSATSDSFSVLSAEDSAYLSAALGMPMKGRYEDPESC